MSDVSNNPDDAVEPPPGRAIRITRIVISLGLAIGVLVFGVFVVEELTNAQPTAGLHNDFGTASGAVSPGGSSTASQGQALQAMGTLDPSKYLTIRRDNPHPGEIVPFLGSASYLNPPYRQPTIAGEVWELGTYRRNDALPEDAFAYYHQEALRRGFELSSKEDTSRAMPGGINATWSDGSHRLIVTAWPLSKEAAPVQPPLKPKTPLKWVVRYSYPENESPRQPTR